MITGFSTLFAAIADVHPIFRPLKKSRPLIVYRQVSNTGGQTHDGPTGIRSRRYQFTVHAETYLEAANVAEQVQTLLDGWSGTLGSDTVGNTEATNVVDLGYFEPTFQTSVDAIFHTEN